MLVNFGFLGMERRYGEKAKAKVKEALAKNTTGMATSL